MQIVLSDSIPVNDKKVVTNIVEAIFKVKNIEITSFQPSRSLFISNNTEEKSDFHFDIAHFVNDNASYKMILFKNLANVIFGEYVDPRDTFKAYENLISGVNIPAPVKVEITSPVIEEIKKLEKEVEIVKEEVAQQPVVIAPVTASIPTTGIATVINSDNSVG